MIEIKNVEYDFNENILVREMGETTMAYNPDNGDMYELNDIGAEILMLLKNKTEIKKIYEMMCEEYHAELEEVYEDINEMLTRMFDLGIIVEKK